MSLYICLFYALLFCAKAEGTLYNVKVQQVPTRPQPLYPLDETNCQLIVSQSENDTFCEQNINTVFSDIIELAVDNQMLRSKNCSYQLNCIEEYCANNEIGQLCRACNSNYSRIFGGLGCHECSNLYLLLIVPFAVAGLLLVIFILTCDLTVSTGQINAILFYANVLHVYKKIQFSEFRRELKFFSVFIAWLNLDLGIETCFYNGMDAYTKVWLQFVFPAYLWMLVIVLFIFTKISPATRRFFGGNCVPTLSVTVIILSYSKVLHTVKAAFTFTWENNTALSTIPLWYEDDTIEYLGPKHTSLFVVAILVSILYLIPVTLVGLFAPCLQAYSHKKALKWISRLKPFLDAYQAPYNKSFEHWTGLMLVIRVIMFILLATNKHQDSSMCYFLVVTIVGPISVFVTVKKNKTVYRKRFSNALEAISLLNLTILNLLSWFLTTTIYTRAIALKQYVTYISISIMIILLLLVIMYQALLIVCPQILFKGRRRTISERLIEESSSSIESDSDTTSEVIKTSSFVGSSQIMMKEHLHNSTTTTFPESPKRRLSQPLLNPNTSPFNSSPMSHADIY